MDSSQRKETQRIRLTGLWQAIRRWLTAHTFAPSWLPGRWAHPAVGYLAAVLLQVIAVMCVVVLVRLFPSFQFQAALVFLLLPSVLAPIVARIEDVLDLLVYLCVGCAVSLLTSQAQHAWRSAEQVRRRLDTIQQAMADAVMVYDSEGYLLLWNAAAEQLLPLQQTDDTSHALLERGEPFLLRDEQGQSLPVDQWPIQRILNGEVLTGIHAVDVLVRLANGREVLMNFSGAPIRDADERVIGGVTIGRDVTERRRLA